MWFAQHPPLLGYCVVEGFRKPRGSSEGQRILGFCLDVSPLGHLFSAGPRKCKRARLGQLGKVKPENRSQHWVYHDIQGYLSKLVTSSEGRIALGAEPKNRTPVEDGGLYHPFLANLRILLFLSLPPYHILICPVSLNKSTQLDLAGSVCKKSLSQMGQVSGNRTRLSCFCGQKHRGNAKKSLYSRNMMT